MERERKRELETATADMDDKTKLKTEMDASRIREKFDESRFARRVKIFDDEGEKREQDHRLKLC